jgi:hypothetical protein
VALEFGSHLFHPGISFHEQSTARNLASLFDVIPAELVLSASAKL